MLPSGTVGLLSASAVVLAHSTSQWRSSTAHFCAFQPVTSSRLCSAPQKVSCLRLPAKRGGDKKAKQGGGPSTAKGFGIVGRGTGADEGKPPMEVLKDRKTLAVMDWAQKAGAKVDNLAVALIGSEKLRGVIALKPFKKGDTIISIPAELALDVTPPNMQLKGPRDPVEAALQLLEQVDDPVVAQQYAPYFATLPTASTKAYATTTDFFTPQELERLVWPPIQDETTARVKRCREAAERTGRPLEDIQWAVWMVVSRSLGVVGEIGQRQLIIPFLDFCNHRADSRHMVSGRAIPGGQLKVIAGEDVAAGDEINFAYGGGCLTSDRFLQDYGFLDSGDNTRKWDKQMLLTSPREYVDRLLDDDVKSLSEDGRAKEGLSIHEGLALDFRVALRNAAAEVRLEGDGRPSQ